MGKVTSGEVTYGRTVKTGDYENKRADVKLYFTVEDDDKYEENLAQAAKEALVRVYAMVGLKLPGAEATVAVTLKKEAETIKETEKPKGRTKANLEAEKLAAVGGAAKTEAVAAPASEKVAAAEGEDLTFDEDAVTEQPEITDEVMKAAMSKAMTKLNKTHEGKGGVMIKALIATFVEPPKKSHDIPQAARPAFLKKLEELK